MLPTIAAQREHRLTQINIYKIGVYLRLKIYIEIIDFCPAKL